MQICPKDKNQMTLQKINENEPFSKLFICEKCGYERKIETD